MSDAYPEPMDVIAIRDGVVVSAAPCAFTMTPDAAVETARRLIEAAQLAVSDELEASDLDDD